MGLGIGLVVMLLLAVLILLAIDLGWERNRLVAFAIDLAEDRFDIEVEVGEASGQISRGIELRQVRIGPAQSPLLTLESLRIRWNAFSLLANERWIADSIRVEGWVVTLHRSADGHWGVLGELIDHLDARDPTQTDPDDASPNILVRRIEFGPGDLEVSVERREPAGSVMPGLTQDTPLRAHWRGQGHLIDLSTGPNEPFVIRDGQLAADLTEIDSGFPDFDRAATAKLKVEFDDKHLKSLVAELDAPGLRADARARGAFDDLDSLVVILKADDLRPVGEWIQSAYPLAGQAQLELHLEGAPDALIGRTHLTAHDLAIEGLRARELDLEAVLGSTLADVLADPMAAQLTLRLRSQGLDPSGLDPSLFEPLMLPPGAADIEIDGTLEQGTFVLARGRLSMPSLEAELTGRGSRTQLDELDFRFESTDIERWLHALRLDLELEGALQGEGHLEGPVSRPYGRIHLSSDALVLDGRPLGTLELSAKRGADEPADLELALGTAQERWLDAEVRIDFTRERVELVASGQAEAVSAFFDPPFELRAQVAAEGFIERTRTGPRFDLALVARDTFIADESIGRVEIEASSESGQRVEITTLDVDGQAGVISLTRPTFVELDPDRHYRLADTQLRLTSAEDSTISGTLTLAAAGTPSLATQLELSIDELPLELTNRFRPSGPPLAGKLRGEMHWQRERGPDWTAGEFEWLDPAVGEVRLDRLAVQWESTPNALDLEIETGFGQIAPLSIRGKIALPEQRSVVAELTSLEGVTLQADLDGWDLSPLEPYTPRWMRRVHGLVSGSVQFEGTDAGPQLQGRAAIAQGSFSIPVLRQRFAPVEALLTFTDGRISIDSVRVGEEGAEANLVGSITFSKDASASLDGQLRFDRFPISRSSVAWMDLDGEIRLAGTVARPELRGSLSIEDGRIGVPAASDPILKEILIASRSGNGRVRESEETDSSLFQEADVDIALSVPSSTRVRGEGANLFVQGEARFLKPSDEELRIRGEARVVNGTYTFQGRRFLVRRGRILLGGGELFDPLLDIEATLPVADIVAIVEVSGPLSQPIVQLRSEPPHSTQDVLSYVLFGRPADSIGAVGESRMDAAAARLAAGVAEAELRDMLGDDMPIDTIDIGADEEGNVSEFGFGKYVGPKLLVRYAHVLGDEPSDRVGLEYRLNELFSVGSSVSTIGDVGLDLIYRHDF